VQLAVHAARFGFQATDTHPTPISGWTYSRVRFAGMGAQGQQVAEYIVRYRPDENLDSPTARGFQVLARCTNPDERAPRRRNYAPVQLIPGGTSTTPVVNLWVVITSGQVPPGIGMALSNYLDGLGQIQVGGQRPPDVSVPNYSSQLMQDPAWVHELLGIVPRS
jgi:hypothetical protein